MVVLDQLALEAIPYVDYPEFRLDEHETTEMPFRYVVDKDGQPIMPQVRIVPETKILVANIWTGHD
jgi:ribosome biogenesis SPOUT family RNA methylase Rps3